MPNTSGNTGVNWCTVAKITFTIMVVVTVIFTILLLVLKGVIPTGSSSTGQEKILSSNSCGNNVNRTDIIISCKRLVEREGLNANSYIYKKCCLLSALHLCLIEETGNGESCGDLPKDHNSLSLSILKNAIAQLGWTVTEVLKTCPMTNGGIIQCKTSLKEAPFNFVQFFRILLAVIVLLLVLKIVLKFLYLICTGLVVSNNGSDTEEGGDLLTGPSHIVALYLPD